MNLIKIKELLEINISDDILLRILFDINKYFDKQLTTIFKQKQKELNRIFNSIERKSLRNYYYFKTIDDLNHNNILEFPTIDYTNNDVNIILNETDNRIKKYQKDKIINSIKQKYFNLCEHRKSSISHRQEWLSYYNNKKENLFDYSMIIVVITNKDFHKHNCDEVYLYDIIKETYAKLENYRHIALVFDGTITDKNDIDITWKLVYKLCIYSENFLQYKENFFACKKEQRISELKNFINERFNIDASQIALDFYENISTGYKFEDCYIGENQNKIILTLKKIILDESHVPCPSCMTTIQSGNSYPEMFLRSFECKNSHCQDRSKSGRGKRFDEYGVYRNFKLEEDKIENRISNELYKQWRRDIFNENNNILEMLIKFYSWDSESILVYNIENNKNEFSRVILKYDYITSYNGNNTYISKYELLPIYKLFCSIKNILHNDTGNILLKDNVETINSNSSNEIPKLLPEQVGTAITSPPYYNAREYSHWNNLLTYLIDMMINCSAVYNTLTKNGFYLYNIGDIVSEDNIYVQSHMSNRRLPLGFLSCMIFEIIGYNLTENIIWDKGEVQSKRNSTINLFTGYVKCINCYEHMFVFKKNSQGINHKKIVQISPVIKINSKGINTYKHTAPYPLELVEQIKPYLIKDKYVLDPYLGSGTTLLWCIKNNFKGLGYELNDEYYKLAIKNIKKEKEDN